MTGNGGTPDALTGVQQAAAGEQRTRHKRRMPCAAASSLPAFHATARRCILPGDDLEAGVVHWLAGRGLEGAVGGAGPAPQPALRIHGAVGGVGRKAAGGRVAEVEALVAGVVDGLAAGGLESARLVVLPAP